MAQRRFHYEQAFEHYLRANGIPYVAVDEAKRALQRSAGGGAPSGLKSFDFVVYSEGGPNLLIDVKGRKHSGRTGQNLQNWVTRDDVKCLQKWAGIFGSGFDPAFAFMFWLHIILVVTKGKDIAQLRAKPMKKQPLVISYLRFSTPQQAQGGSYERQLEQSQRWAESRGLQIDESLEDLGVSAFRGSNATTGALSRLTELLDDGKIPEGSYLLVESLDRLSRNQLLKAQELFLSLINRGLVIVTLADGEREYSAENADLGNLIISLVIMSRAHEESQTKSHRNKADWDRRKKRARAGEKTTGNNCPSWLRFEDGEYKVDHEAAMAVRRAFELTINGYGCVSVAKKLREEFPEGITRSGEWRTAWVKQLLHNKSVLGEYQPHRIEYKGNRKKSVPDGDPISDYYPPIIDEDTFYQAQASRDRRKKTGGRGSSYINLFQGIGFYDCGSRINLRQTSPKTKNGKKYPNYRYYCKADGIQGKTSQDKFDVGAFEMAFVNIMSTVADQMHQQPDHQPKIDAAQGRLNEIDEKIDDISEQIVEHGTSKAVVAVLNKLEKQKEELQAQIEQLRRESSIGSDDALEKLVKEWYQLQDDLYKGKVSHDKRRELREIIKRIVKRLTINVESLNTNRRYPRKACHVKVELMNGEEIVYTVEHHKQTNGNPLIRFWLLDGVAN